MAVLKAVNTLKEKYPNIVCIITGHPKVNSSKSKGYVEGLMNYIEENQLSQHIQFLGLISREDQLCLLKNSMAIIQPSFFESWNTTVEDAKLLGKYIILSDLVVHKEQISKHVYFFNPDNVDELVAGMAHVMDNRPADISDYDYSKNTLQFAKDIVKMLD
jgi:glycosyltransferase involved in cell wall biosynthesis